MNPIHFSKHRAGESCRNHNLKFLFLISQVRSLSWSLINLSLSLYWIWTVFEEFTKSMIFNQVFCFSTEMLYPINDGSSDLLSGEQRYCKCKWDISWCIKRQQTCCVVWRTNIWERVTFSFLQHAIDISSIHNVNSRFWFCSKIQSVFELSDGSGLVVTVARYETPAHTDIDKVL